MTYEDRPFTVESARALNAILDNNRHALLSMGTGTGKTYVCLRAIAERDPNAHIVLITMKAKVLSRDWEMSIDAFNATMGTSLTMASQTFQSGSKPKYGSVLLEDAKAHKRPAYFVIDEIQEIRNPTGVHAKGIIQLASNPTFQRVIGLSATPRPNNPFEMVTYLILNGDYKNKTQFLRTHAVRYDDYYRPIYKNDNDVNHADELNEKIERITLYVDAASYLLPDVIPHYVEIPENRDYTFAHPIFDSEKHPFNDTTPRTVMGHYNQALRYLRDGWIDNPAALNETLNYILSTDPERQFALYKILQAHFGTPDATPVVIAYERNSQKDAITAVCEKLGIAMQYVNAKHKELHEPPTSKTALIVQYASGGTGVEFAFARAMIFYMPPTFNFNAYEQMKGRNVRFGMTGEVHHYFLHTKSRRDFLMWRGVFMKKHNMDAWLQEINRTELETLLQEAE